ncbi:Stage III sporulation protein AB (spore_III_AB) [Caminicella sporogenes DSM 14501]|uniref:Stage III sporulation protein AB (Spore_III_AB) n=1 Tax=Caminicella sporogenes DSM 14501 TaxID=1121266 RepID=A0A1M6LMJ5_9FIRM|nr:hypothetical protein [Caminicella sporogenes]RKD27883.1 hypothetical protein BET04_02140 [Caminicella sporogenes]SHJ72384.1 Stage III sporulation protein AB (spore_III_AB) [Caminicella sporogenes DSM 14501]
MIKIFLCSILLFSSSAIGYLISLGYSFRIRDLNDIQSALNRLESEIIYYSTSLPLAMEKIAKLCNGNTSKIFKEVSKLLNSKEGYRIDEAWKISVLKFKSKTNFNREDIEIIINFGKDLGVVSKEVQKKHFNFIRDLLEEQKKKAMYQQNKNGKMYSKLGVILGLALIVILI